jgi:hypothetical protein
VTRTDVTIPADTSVATRLARALTEILAPVVLIVVLLFAVSIHTADSWQRGLLLGFVTSLLVGVLPYAVLLLGVRRGRLGDRHLSERTQRPAMMVLGLASATIGLLLAIRLDAPRELFALLAAMVTGIVVALAVTTFWKISIHAACVAGTVTILAMAIDTVWVALVPIALATAWARVRLGDHTSAQAIAALIIGALVAGNVYAALT